MDVSLAEVLVVVGVGVAVIGKRELPLYARQVGSSVGRLVGTLIRTRQSLDGFAKHNELTQLHAEFQAGVSELSQIRGELLNATTMQRQSRPVPQRGSVGAHGISSAAAGSAPAAAPIAYAAASSSHAPQSAVHAASAVPAATAAAAAATGAAGALSATAPGAAATAAAAVTLSAASQAALSQASLRPSRVTLAVATEKFAAEGAGAGADSGAPSGADLLSEGIIDAIWLDEHLAKAAKGE
jgi:Sec-independent protein translocase protein TatA